MVFKPPRALPAKHIGKRLQKFIVKNHLILDDFSDIFGISKSGASRLVNDQRKADGPFQILLSIREKEFDKKRKRRK